MPPPWQSEVIVRYVECIFLKKRKNSNKTLPIYPLCMQIYCRTLSKNKDRTENVRAASLFASFVCLFYLFISVWVEVEHSCGIFININKDTCAPARCVRVQRVHVKAIVRFAIRKKSCVAKTAVKCKRMSKKRYVQNVKPSLNLFILGFCILRFPCMRLCVGPPLYK